MIEIRNEFLTVGIKPFGAELCSLCNALGEQFLWQAGAVWPKHAPVLFPIVGQVNGNIVRVDGHEFQLLRHGFAHEMEFSVEIAAPDQARFVLQDTNATRAIYPFAFRLTLIFALSGPSLRVTQVVENPSDKATIFSIGGHPAFIWSQPHDAQELIFDQPEPAPVRRLRDGLLAPELHQTPISDRRLALSDALFVDDALILDQVQSRTVSFGRLRVSWCDAMPQLGIWTKPGADFLCLEPWAGYADPVGFAGEFADKPGVMRIPPGERAEFWWEVSIA